MCNNVTCWVFYNVVFMLLKVRSIYVVFWFYHNVSIYGATITLRRIDIL